METKSGGLFTCEATWHGVLRFADRKALKVFRSERIKKVEGPCVLCYTWCHEATHTPPIRQEGEDAPHDRISENRQWRNNDCDRNEGVYSHSLGRKETEDM